jgi:ATP-binding cassette, subfamily B, bacterial
MWHGGGGWWSVYRIEHERPKITWTLMRRVLQYGKPYRWHIAGMLFLILVSTGLNLLSPLLVRDLIDRTLPAAISTGW